MNRAVSFRAARAAATAAIVARLFLGLVVDAPTTHNGAWLSALLGALLAAPWVLSLRALRGCSDPAHLPLHAALLGIVIVDAATVLSALTRSAGYLALDRSPALLLALPPALAALWCIWRGGEAVGNAATLALRVAFALLVVVVLLQARYFKTQWLAPVLGDGAAAVVDGGVRAASWIVAASAILAVSDNGKADDRPALSVLSAVGFAAIACAGLIVLRLMLTPTQLSDWTWLNRLDALLCNGRTPLYLQLPMIAMWFSGLLHLLSSECCAASALLKQLLPQLSARACGALVVTAALLLSQSAIVTSLQRFLSMYGFPVVGLLTVLALLTTARAKGGSAQCG